MSPDWCVRISFCDDALTLEDADEDWGVLEEEDDREALATRGGIFTGGINAAEVPIYIG